MSQSVANNFDQAECIALLRNQQPKAMEIIYDQFSSLLFGVALKMVNEPDVARELLEKTFLHVWKNHASYDVTKQSLCMWMLCELRKLAQQKVPFKTYIQNNNSFYHIENPNSTDKRIDTNPHKVLELIFIGGGKINEVAKQLSMDENNVKQLLHQAISSLRAKSHMV